MKKTFSLLYYLKKLKNYKTGPMPVYVRITVDGKRSETATGRDCGLMNTACRFKDNGYEVSMVYIGLSDLKQSMDRVNACVKGGGHFVDAGSIRYNYEEGLTNLIYFADQFDNLEFIDASGDLYELKSLLSVQSRQLVFVSDQIPAWAEPAIDRIKTITGIVHLTGTMTLAIAPAPGDRYEDQSAGLCN